jgi:hypothetical protein
MKKTKSDDSKMLLAKAEELREQALSALQIDLVDNTTIYLGGLQHVADNLRGEAPRPELAKELRKLREVIDSMIGPQKTKSGKQRSGKVSTLEKMDWLKKRLANGAEVQKGKLVDEFAELKQMRNFPTLLDKALKGNQLFKMRDEGRCVMVSLAKEES